MPLSLVQTALLDCLRIEPSSLPQLDTAGWEMLVETAVEQHVAPLLYTRLKAGAGQLPKAVTMQLQNRYFENIGHHLALYAAFKQLCRQLQDANIPLIPLKGIYLADTVYQTGERVIGDLDLLVPKSQAVTAFEIAQASGYQPIKPVVMEAWLAQKHQLCPQAHPQSQVTIEWHWHMMPPTDHNLLIVDQLWAHSQPQQVAHQDVLTLSHEDTILHLAYHLSYHHNFLFGLRNLCDIAVFCTRYAIGIDWNQVVKRAQAWRIERGVYLSLKLAQVYLGAPIPETVFQMCKPTDFSPHQLELAIEQLFVPPNRVYSISLTRQRVQGAVGGLGKVQAIRQALFPTSDEMAIRYGGIPKGMSRLARYLFRWRSLARQAIYKMGHRELEKTAVSAMLKRQQKLSAWLYKKE